MPHAFVIGGTGQVGRAVAGELLSRGWAVTLGSREGGSRPVDLLAMGARFKKFDRDVPGELARALSEGTDAVVDVIANSVTHADQLLELQGGVGAFVVISTSGVYRDDAGRSLDDAEREGFPNFPAQITEDQPTVEPGPQTYATRKVALERRMLENSNRPVTILRPGAIYGPHSTHPREWWFVKRMLDGRPIIPLAHGGSSRFHTLAVTDLATLVHASLAQPATRIMNAADAVPPTVMDIGTAIADRLDYGGVILPIDNGDDRGSVDVGWSPWSVARPFVLSTAAAAALRPIPQTTYADAVSPAVDWLARTSPGDWKRQFPVLASYPRELFDYAAEDAYLLRVGTSA